MAPMRTIDYVVIHELCHLRHHDHSKAFWKMLGLYLPDYLERKEWLRVNGGLLSLG
jgi:predicted metal-dependent hydrolase